MSLSLELRNKIREAFRNKFTSNDGVFVFRRIIRVNPGQLVSSIRFESGPDDCYPMCNNDTVKVKPSDFPKCTELFHNTFGCITAKSAMREEDRRVFGKQLYLQKDRCFEADLFNESGKFPTVFIREKRQVPTPFKDDLALVFISNNTLNASRKANSDIKADKWAVVSNQLLHAYTALFSDWDDSFDALIGKEALGLSRDEKEKRYRKKLMAGNVVITNSYGKYVRVLGESGQTASITELQKRYWRLRSEKTSITEETDCYAALITMVRYGEMITNKNIPIFSIVENGLTFTKKRWYLPRCFCGLVFSVAGIGGESKNYIETNIVGYEDLRKLYPEDTLLFEVIHNTQEMERIEVPITPSVTVLSEPNTINVALTDAQTTSHLLKAVKPWDKPRAQTVQPNITLPIPMPPKPEFTFKFEVNQSCDWSELAQTQEDEW